MTIGGDNFGTFPSYDGGISCSPVRFSLFAAQGISNKRLILKGKFAKAGTGRQKFPASRELRPCFRSGGSGQNSTE
jgi:hypothetical protein